MLFSFLVEVVGLEHEAAGAEGVVLVESEGVGEAGAVGPQLSG